MNRTIPILLAAAAIVTIAFEVFRRHPQSATGLRQSAETGNYDDLAKALRSRQIKDRINAVKSLVDFGSDEAAKLLGVAAQDKATVVRVAVIQSLPKLTEKHSLPLVKILLDDRESGLVRETIKELERLTKRKYQYRPEASSKEKDELLEKCKRDIDGRLRQILGV